MTTDPQIDCGGAKPQIAQDNFMEEFGQPRITQADLTARGIEFEAERSL